MPTQSSNTSVLAELYKYSPSAIVELFEIDLTPLVEYYTSIGRTISPTKYYFHNGTNKYAQGTPPLSNIDVKWGSPERTYTARSISMEGIQTSSAGEIPRPTLTINNYGSTFDNLFTELNKSYANLVGAKITRIRTLVKFLNATNFPAGNATADPNAKFPDDVFNIDRMSEEVPGQITYELAPAWDVEGVALPRRQILANICPWTYKEDPCNWSVSGVVTASSAGTAVAGTATYTTLTPTTLTGTGSGLVVSVTRTGGSYTTTITRMGSGYVVGNTAKVLGSLLGGVDVTNDLTLTIGSITGANYYDENDIIATTAANDRCGKRYTSCKIRFGTKVMPFGGFPSAGLYGKPI
jgi:lambda family phage minor tail protein L